MAMAAIEPNRHFFLPASSRPQIPACVRPIVTGDLGMAQVGDLNLSTVAGNLQKPQIHDIDGTDSGVREGGFSSISHTIASRTDSPAQTSDSFSNESPLPAVATARAATAAADQQAISNEATPIPSLIPDQPIPRAGGLKRLFKAGFVGGNRQLISGNIIFPALEPHITLLARERFNGFIIFINAPLNRYFAKKGIWVTGESVSIDLRLVGATATEARLTIVVSCPPKILSRLRKFFRKKHIKSMYQPDVITPEEPWFEIDFDPEGPRLFALEALEELEEFAAFLPQGVYDAKGINKFPSGLPVLFGIPDFNLRLATMGGVIEVKIDSKPTSLLYGMTVGHAIYPPEAVSAKTRILKIRFDMFESESDSSDSEDEDSNYSEDEPEELGKDKDLEGEPGGVDTDSNWYEPEIQPSVTADSAEPYLLLGAAFRSPLGPRYDFWTRNLDWGLISEPKGNNIFQIASSRFPLPRLNLHNSEQEGLWSRPKFVLSEDNMSAQNVFFLSGVDGSDSKGHLIFGSSMIRLQEGQYFTKVHRLRLLPGMRRIKPGDCGAWVVDTRTGEVYGHIVASNALNEGYIIPLQDSFEQIKAVLDASQVRVYDGRGPPKSEISSLENLVSSRMGHGMPKEAKTFWATEQQSNTLFGGLKSDENSDADSGDRSSDGPRSKPLGCYRVPVIDIDQQVFENLLGTYLGSDATFIEAITDIPSGLKNYLYTARRALSPLEISFIARESSVKRNTGLMTEREPWPLEKEETKPKLKPSTSEPQRQIRG